jgi:hypothetical protein
MKTMLLVLGTLLSVLAVLDLGGCGGDPGTVICHQEDGRSVCSAEVEPGMACTEEEPGITVCRHVAGLGGGGGPANPYMDPTGSPPPRVKCDLLVALCK